MMKIIKFMGTWIAYKKLIELQKHKRVLDNLFLLIFEAFRFIHIFLCMQKLRVCVTQ
jgi:hypothetical protein